jgi:hypothetical protein
MTITHFCFCVGCLAALSGMGLGIAMGVGQDFSLAPVHAHLNLLGWVTMALYGLYYRDRALAARWIEWAQVSAATIGFPLMTGGLALLLTVGMPGSAEAIVIAGSMLTIGAMALFFAIVVADARRFARRQRRRPADDDHDANSG